MIDIDPNQLAAKVIAIDFTLRNFVPERLGMLQMMLAGQISSVDFRHWASSETASVDMTLLQGRISPLYLQQGMITALHREICEQSCQAIDEFGRVYRRRCDLVDVQLLVDRGDGCIKLFPKTGFVTELDR